MAWTIESRTSCSGGCSVVIEQDRETKIFRAVLDIFESDKLYEVGTNAQDAKKRLAERLEVIANSLRGGR